jgi:hypothetical protein
MSLYDKAKILGFLRTVDQAKGKKQRAVKGRAFEDLARYLFEGIPGVAVTARDKVNLFGTEEIDLACLNHGHPEGLITLPPNFLVECKGWRHPVGSEQVAWFLMKIRHRGLDFGILIAAKGITGEPGERTASHFIVSVELAAARSIRMVVVTRNEIETLQSGEQFARMLIEKVTRLHATGQCY